MPDFDFTDGRRPLTFFGGETQELPVQDPLLADALTLQHSVSPPPALLGHGQLYVKPADGKLYYKDELGVEYLISAGQAPYSDIVLADAGPLKRYYRLNETSGTVVTDLSGNAQHGTYYQGATPGFPTSIAGLIPGDTDTAISFDGVDDNISVPFVAGDFPNGFLWGIEALVKLPTTSEKGTFISISDGVRRFCVGVGDTSFDNAGNNLVLLVSNIAFNNLGIALGTNTFHVATFYYSSTFHTLLNGRLVNTWSPSTFGLGYGGAIGAEAGASSTRSGKAIIDEAAFYIFPPIGSVSSAFFEAHFYRRALRALKGI